MRSTTWFGRMNFKSMLLHGDNEPDLTQINHNSAASTNRDIESPDIDWCGYKNNMERPTPFVDWMRLCRLCWISSVSMTWFADCIQFE